MINKTVIKAMRGSNRGKTNAPYKNPGYPVSYEAIQEYLVGPDNEDPDEPGLFFDLDKLKSYIPRLPLWEQDMVEMYFYYRLTQFQIASILGVVQPAICHQLRRAKKRLEYFFGLDQFYWNENDFIPYLEPDTFRIWTLARENPGQSFIMRETGIPQPTVRLRLLKIRQIIEQTPELNMYLPYWNYVWDHRTILISYPNSRRGVRKIQALQSTE